MEKGDIYGLIGMVMGIQAAINIILYYVFGMIPLYQSFWGILLVTFYATIYGGGIAGIILSIIGISMNGSKFAIIGLISAALAVSLFTAILLGVLPSAF